MFPVEAPPCAIEGEVDIHNVADQLVGMLQDCGMRPVAFVRQDEDGVAIKAHMVQLELLGTTCTVFRVLLEEQLCMISVRVNTSLDSTCSLHWSCEGTELAGGIPDLYHEYTPGSRGGPGHVRKLSRDEVRDMISQNHPQAQGWNLSLCSDMNLWRELLTCSYACWKILCILQKSCSCRSKRRGLSSVA